MRNKRGWYSILLIGLVLLLTSLVVGCPQPSVSAPPVIAEFKANPSEIISGESATLLWSVTGATTVTIDQDIGDVPKGGTQLVSPTTTSAYTLTAINNAGIVTKAVVITVIPPMEGEGEGEEKHEPPPAQVPTKGELKVHFIDVGQGDSILVDLGETEVLIDGGDKSSGVVTYLDDFVDGALEVMVATHPHADHIGGLIGVLNAFEVDEIWLNGDTSTSQTYSQFMSAVNSEGAQVYEARRGNTIEVSELVFNVLHPVSLDDTINNNSIVLSLSYGEVDFLFMGDAEKEAESNMLQAGIVPDVEILKVGHHGSNSSSSPEFLHAVKPETAIYLAGEGNTYGHPHRETTAALTEVGADIYGTDIHSTIVVTTDGEKYELQSEKPAAPRVPSIVSPTPAEFTVTNLVISPIEVEQKETVTITATVTNSGGSTGTHTVVLKVNNAELTTESVTLEAGESQIVSFTVTRFWGGTYRVDVNGLEGTFTVVEVIEDLAYIKIMALGYTDDADPEPEGISLRIMFYDSKSEVINFQNVSITVTIEIYSDKNRELVYEEQATKTRSMGFGTEIRIPFEKILIDHNNYDKLRTIEVTVTTPKQGDFRATSSLLLPRAEKVEQEEDLFLEIVSVTSPIGKGYTATLQAKTAPGAYCTITVYYKSGPSGASGLYPKEADTGGNVSWSWKVGTRTTPGSWRIVVTASVDGKTTSQTTYFTVY